MSISGAGFTKRRAPTVAGIFYPDDPQAAQAALAAFDAEKASEEPRSNQALAVIAPHAGWELSGSVAADAFKAAAGRRISTVVVIGPLHQDKAEGIFLSESEYFETPIGDLAVDRELCAELESCGTFFITNDIPHLEEHSIEILLPFIKRSFPAASIVPILTGGNRTSIIRSLSGGLDIVFGPIADSTLIVVSTNLCANLATATANAHAEKFLACLAAGDHAGLIESTGAGTISACGAAGCAALVGTELIGKKKPTPLSSSNTAERPDHDPKKLVRYASLAYF